MVLVDTSVWIEVFRQGHGLDLESEVNFESVVTCLPVIQEVLQGFGDSRVSRSAREAMFALPIVESPLACSVFDEAVGLYRAGRRGGFTIRSSIDCLIAACAIRNDLSVFHCDRDFDHLSRVSPLRVQRLRRRR